MHPNYNKYSSEFTEIITKLKKEKGFLKTAGDLDKLTFKLIEKYEQLDNIESQQ